MYVGTPGSGKSLKTAYEIIDCIKSGKNVIANFPIDEGYFKKKKPRYGQFDYVPNKELTAKFLFQYYSLFHKANKEGQTVVIIDEASNLFSSDYLAGLTRKRWKLFFEQHRKLGFDVILITQSLKSIDTDIKGCIEYESRFRCVKRFKMAGFLLSAIFRELFVVHTYWYPVKQKVSTTFFRLSKRKANIYNTFEIFKDSERFFSELL